MDGYLDSQSLSSPPSVEARHSPASSSVSPQAQGSTSTPASTNAGTIPSMTRVRRRNRMITSCLECRRRKLKCDKSHPCNNCTKGHRDCIFLAPALDQASQLKLTEIKEKVGSLERLLGRDVARTTIAPSVSMQSERALPDDADDDLPGAEDEKDLEPTPLAVVDAAYDDDAEDDNMLDLGIQIGKMRLTERVGGFFRPKIAQELDYSLSDEAKKGFAEPRNSLPVVQPSSQGQYDYLKPGPGYIAPASNFFFGQGNNNATLIDFLPSRLAADRLIKQYFTAVNPITQAIHRPTFESEYESFWDEVSLGIEPGTSVQAIVFAAMFSGVVSMDESIITRDFGVSKESLIDNFKLGTETALGRANFLRTTKVETLQAFVIYLIPLCRAEMSRAHSVLVGAAIRMAECMGLHRDGETYGLNPLEIHVRRLIWHQICFLDIRTCEAQGPRPAIRREDFDTQLPLNVDDVDLHASGKPPNSVDRWTDATFTLIRFECNEMMRQIWMDRPRIERRKISLTAVLSKIETFKRNMAAKYDHLIDERIPLQKCAQVVKTLLLSRLYVMVLHRYHNSVANTMPERLRQIMLSSGTVLLESAVALDCAPEISTWNWYSGAYHQYHAAFLLLIDVHFYSSQKEADRIWNCLDYIFDTDRSATRPQKARTILKEMQEKTAVYQQMRKMRAPSAMLKHVGQRAPRKIEEGQPPMLGYDEQAIFGQGSTSVGRAPMPEAVYAGVSNGEILWAVPNQGSPAGSSETSSVMGQMNPPMATLPLGDVMMPDIDWEAFDALFPPEQSDELNIDNCGLMNQGLF